MSKKSLRNGWIAKNKFTVLSLFIALVMFGLVKAYHPAGVSPQGTIVGGSIATGTAQIGGEFEMVDQDGNPFTHLNLQGKYSLMFFGFTFCPDICPTSLLLAKEVRDGLPEEMKERLQVVFVTVDPGRDTPEVLKSYLGNMDNDFIGLTGTAAQVKEMADVYRVYYAKRESGDGFYLMDHSGFMYLMGPDGQYLQHFSHKTTAEEMGVKVRDLMYR